MQNEVKQQPNKQNKETFIKFNCSFDQAPKCNINFVPGEPNSKKDSAIKSKQINRANIPQDISLSGNSQNSINSDDVFHQHTSLTNQNAGHNTTSTTTPNLLSVPYNAIKPNNNSFLTQLQLLLLNPNLDSKQKQLFQNVLIQNLKATPQIAAQNANKANPPSVNQNTTNNSETKEDSNISKPQQTGKSTQPMPVDNQALVNAYLLQLTELSHQQHLAQLQSLRIQNNPPPEPKISKRKKNKGADSDDYDDPDKNKPRKKSKDETFAPSSTMYSTHHALRKSLQDPSDDELLPFMDDTNLVEWKSPHHNAKHTSSSRKEKEKEKEITKFIYKPLDPRVPIKRRYASWAEITDYGQWHFMAKNRPHIIEKPQEVLNQGKKLLEQERDRKMDFDSDFSILSCLKVVSNDLENLTKNTNQNENSNLETNQNENNNLETNQNENNQRNNDIEVKNGQHINYNTFSSVITPVLTKRRIQRPDHIKICNIIDMFDLKMMGITTRACLMLDRLIFRENLKRNAPMLMQSLNEIAPYVWREYQKSKKKVVVKNPSNKRKRKRKVDLEATLASQVDQSREEEDVFHVIRQTFNFLNISEQEDMNYACEIGHMNPSENFTFHPSFEDLVRYFRQIKGTFVSHNSSGYVLEK